MVVTERPGGIEGTASGSPELLFPEARQRRRNRWLIAGAASFVIMLGVLSAALLLVGHGGRTSVVLSPAADRLLFAVHTTEAAKTAAFTQVYKTTAPPSLRTLSGGVNVGFVRFPGPVEQIGFPPPENRSLISYCSGRTAYLPNTAQVGWRTEKLSAPCSPLTSLSSWTSGGAPVTYLGEQQEGRIRVSEYLVRRPASVVQGLRWRAANMYVWVDSKGRIIRTVIPDQVSERPSGSGPGFVNVTSYEELTLSNFGVSFDPRRPTGPFTRD